MKRNKRQHQGPREAGPHGKTLEMRAGPRQSVKVIHAHPMPIKLFEKPPGMVPYRDPAPARDRSLIGKARRRARSAS